MQAAVALPSLAIQLVTISVVVLQRTYHHNRIGTTRPIQPVYDFVVVGSGSAGSVIASRLAENRTISVLVLEAGPPQNVLTDMPAIRLFNTEIDWAYETVSQAPYASNSVIGGRMALPKGRVVGGTHNLNLLAYSRGNRRDYDSWASDYGATGWSFREVLPYFLRSENNTDASVVAANPAYHSTRGPMVVRTLPNKNTMLQAFFDALGEMGYQQTDVNGPHQLGYNFMPQTVFLNGTRSTTASCYLEANMERSNLQVLPNAFVTRILFQGSRAIGVEYERSDGRVQRVLARYEVILSAGAYNTPQLLMLSGIGPRSHLSQLGIQTRVDLPVGQYLQDHPGTMLQFSLLDSNPADTSPAQLSVTSMYEYFTRGQGELATNSLLCMYINTHLNRQLDWPDVRLNFMVSRTGTDLDTLVAGRRNAEAWREYYRPYLGTPTLTVLIHLYRPISRGGVYLNTTNPHDHPLIDPGYLREEQDAQRLVAGLNYTMRLMNKLPFSSFVRLWNHSIPGCELCPPNQQLWECASYLECYARSLTIGLNHHVGSARMGTDPKSSVIDPQLRVRGVSGLCVVDGSAAPAIMNSNSNAAFIMIAERAAQFVKQQYNI